jgi:hypothetical protein
VNNAASDIPAFRLLGSKSQYFTYQYILVDILQLEGIWWAEEIVRTKIATGSSVTADP